MRPSDHRTFPIAALLVRFRHFSSRWLFAKVIVICGGWQIQDPGPCLRVFRYGVLRTLAVFPVEPSASSYSTFRSAFFGHESMLPGPSYGGFGFVGRLRPELPRITDKSRTSSKFKATGLLGIAPTLGTLPHTALLQRAGQSSPKLPLIAILASPQIR